MVYSLGFDIHMKVRSSSDAIKRLMPCFAGGGNVHVYGDGIYSCGITAHTNQIIIVSRYMGALRYLYTSMYSTEPAPPT